MVRPAKHAPEMRLLMNGSTLQDIYDYGYNGLCYKGAGQNNPATGWGPYPKITGCRIDFGPGATPPTNTNGGGGGSQKRAIGEFNGWPIYGMHSRATFRRIDVMANKYL
jgi:hypothetical protein